MGWISNPNTNFDSIYDKSYYEGKGADVSVTYWDEMFSAGSSLNHELRDIEYFGIRKTLFSTQDSNSNKPLKHLDFGGGLGGLVRYMNEKGGHSVLSETGFSLEIANKIGIPTEEKPQLSFYDLITAVEVFEHWLIQRRLLY